MPNRWSLSRFSHHDYQLSLFVISLERYSFLLTNALTIVFTILVSEVTGWRRRLRVLLFTFLLLVVIQPTSMVAAASNNVAAKFGDEERRLLRQLFLRRFGLDQLVESQPARRLDTEEIPDYIWQLYEDAQDDDEHHTVRHYFPAANDQHSVRFDLHATNRQPINEHISYANLRVRLPSQIASGESQGRVVVYDRLGRLLDEQHVPLMFTRNNWVDLDVTSALQSQSMNRNDENVELTLKYITDDITDNLIDEITNSTALVVYVSDVERRSQRSKRNVAVGNGRTTRKHRKHRKHHNTLGPHDGAQCRRTKLYVDFAELNWHDWIMAPAGYDAYQCQGQCIHPMPSNLNTTNHAIIQSLIHSIDPSAVPPPSCVPTETSAISILYRDINNTVVVKTYADMRVDACGCH
ncbi:CBN-DBL-1 protein [Aphelenchoides besseyi]|nr:CBN-DBL-1 protein [Aphelenchoides besseyi]